ncbi:MAG: hypothetical protein DWH80_01085 [Planctomycetota bacterium]|nr:MAG: hypothetical protein DWH80_01085 [Planctomycetota bacterium]
MVSITRKKLSQTQDSETGIAGLLGSSPEKTKAFVLKTGLAKAYISYEEVQIPVLVLFISVFPVIFIF